MDDENVPFSAEKSTFRPEKSDIGLKGQLFSSKGTFSASILCPRIRPLDGNGQKRERTVLQ